MIEIVALSIGTAQRGAFPAPPVAAGDFAALLSRDAQPRPAPDDAAARPDRHDIADTGKDVQGTDAVGLAWLAAAALPVPTAASATDAADTLPSGHAAASPGPSASTKPGAGIAAFPSIAAPITAPIRPAMSQPAVPDAPASPAPAEAPTIPAPRPAEPRVPVAATPVASPAHAAPAQPAGIVAGADAPAVRPWMPARSAPDAVRTASQVEAGPSPSLVTTAPPPPFRVMSAHHRASGQVAALPGRPLPLPMPLPMPAALPDAPAPATIDPSTAGGKTASHPDAVPARFLPASHPALATPIATVPASTAPTGEGLASPAATPLAPLTTVADDATTPSGTPMPIDRVASGPTTVRSGSSVPSETPAAISSPPDPPVPDAATMSSPIGAHASSVLRTGDAAAVRAAASPSQAGSAAAEAVGATAEGSVEPRSLAETAAPQQVTPSSRAPAAWVTRATSIDRAGALVPPAIPRTGAAAGTILPPVQERDAALPPEPGAPFVPVASVDRSALPDDTLRAGEVAPQPAFDRTPAAGAVPAPAPAPLAPRDPGFAEAMIDRIETLRDAEGTVRETRIRLTPDALGTVEVRLVREGDGLRVQLSADNPQAARLLAEAQPRLLEAAEGRGLRLAGSGTDAGMAERGDRQHQSEQQQRDRPRPARFAAAATRTDTDTRIA